MKKPTYVIVHAGTIQHLQTVVNSAMADGYVPTGGPVNVSSFNPPVPTLAQAMVLVKPRKLESAP